MRESEYLLEILDRFKEIASCVAYANTAVDERAIWISRVVRHKKFSIIAVELNLSESVVRRKWFRLLNRIADEVRFAAMADERLRNVLGQAISDPDAFFSILAAMLSLHYPPRLF
jgi:hypothetical protein